MKARALHSGLEQWQGKDQARALAVETAQASDAVSICCKPVISVRYTPQHICAQQGTSRASQISIPIDHIVAKYSGNVN